MSDLGITRFQLYSLHVFEHIQLVQIIKLFPIWHISIFMCIIITIFLERGYQLNKE